MDALRAHLSVKGLPFELFPRGHRLGVVVGNTRALWPAFRRHLRGLGVRDEAELGPDPLDIYVEELILGSLIELRDSFPVDFEVAFAHDLSGPILPVQRIADFSGMARLGPVHLSIHPSYGPWIALRAVFTLDLPLEAGIALGWADPAPRPCDGCQVQCRRALSNALLDRDAPLPDLVREPPMGLSTEKARWLAVRDICPVGSQARYTDDQILYHYDKNRHALLK